MEFVPESIEKSYNYLEEYTSHQDRYFTIRYALNVRHPGDDYRILIHSNRICVVTLSPSHELLKKETKVEEIDFQVSEKTNTITNKVCGKKKRNAQWLQPESPLFIAKCNDSKYKLCASISGKLLEVNPALLENPQLLITNPESTGYLAIVLPNPPLVDQYKSTLTTKEEFDTLQNNVP